MPASALATSNNDQDIDLASRCAAGERAAQRQLFDEHKSRVHGTLYRILGSNRDMEDLIQESFLQVFRSISSYRGDARLATWISRISARVAYTYLSRRKLPTVALESVPETPAGDAGAERHAIAREATRRLYGVLDRIDAKQRIAFALHVIDGLPLREVAEITDATVVAVKTRVWRARKEVAKRAKNDPLLAEYYAGESEGSQRGHRPRSADSPRNSRSES
jgi:RNA polymerase sigma-70 factor (ECF subfamily)